MKIPLQITVRNASISEAVNNEIQEKASKLDQYSDHIIGCRVTVDNPHRHQHEHLSSRAMRGPW